MTLLLDSIVLGTEKIVGIALSAIFYSPHQSGCDDKEFQDTNVIKSELDCVKDLQQICNSDQITKAAYNISLLFLNV